MLHDVSPSAVRESANMMSAKEPLSPDSEPRSATVPLPSWVWDIVAATAESEGVRAEQVIADAVVAHRNTNSGAFIRFTNYVISQAINASASGVLLKRCGDRFDTWNWKSSRWNKVVPPFMEPNESLPFGTMERVAERLLVMSTRYRVTRGDQSRIWFYEVLHGVAFAVGDVRCTSVELSGANYKVIIDIRMPGEVLLLIAKEDKE